MSMGDPPTSYNYESGYAAGYNDGFRAGVASARYTMPAPVWPNQQPYYGGINCSVCGKYFEANKAYGYVCPNAHCPSKVYCSTPSSNSAQATWSSWMTGRLSNEVKISDPGPCDHESYGAMMYRGLRDKGE